jgi:carboxyl-terminal processing protease
MNRSVATFLLVWGLGGCASRALEWQPLESGQVIGRPELYGVWENPATGHVVQFTPHRTAVFHRLDDFCIRDTGVVPPYSLYRVEPRRGELLLHYYDYRTRPSLLQAPLVFRRAISLPEACGIEESEIRADPNQLYGLVTRAFDRFYPFFGERKMDWGAQKARFSERARALSTDEQLFDLLAEMLKPLGDGHVNVTWSGRSFNAAAPRLRTRLRDAWAAAGTTLSEGAFVSAWHRGVMESIYPVLDTDSRRSGAAGALEWGTIADTVGYVRVNRFTGFAAANEPRPVQYDSLASSLSAMQKDLTATTLLIVDVALNGGGSDAAAQLIAAFFADRRRPVLRYEADGSPSHTIFVEPAGAGERRPVLLVTSEVTASAAEAFVLMMRAFPHVTHVGERTRGDLSSLLPKPFPNGFRVTLAYQHVLDDAGTSYEGVGIPPDHMIELFPDSNMTGGFAAALTALARAGQ